MVRGQRVIAISQFIKHHIVENYNVPPDKVDLAPRGFSPNVFDLEKISHKDLHDLRQNLNVKSDELLICLPGRLTRWKGQVEFIKCLEGIRDLPGWKALLVGGCGRKKSYEAELIKLCVDLNLEDRVIFAGSQKNMPLYYAVSDIVVSASVEPEAFGRVAVEAQAMQKPIIATAHGGSLETVLDGDTGWLIPVDDIGQLTVLLQKIISGDFDLKQIGSKAKVWVQGNFTTDLMCEAEWLAYSKLI
jgi:glycosyltransferase involved in cell wall biosynthesis